MSSWDYRCTPPYLASFFVFLLDTGLHYVGQAGLELLTTDDPHAFTSQSAGITGVIRGTWRVFLFVCFFLFVVIVLRENISVSPPLFSPGNMSKRLKHIATCTLFGRQIT